MLFLLPTWLCGYSADYCAPSSVFSYTPPSVCELSTSHVNTGYHSAVGSRCIKHPQPNCLMPRFFFKKIISFKGKLFKHPDLTLVEWHTQTFSTNLVRGWGWSSQATLVLSNSKPGCFLQVGYNYHSLRIAPPCSRERGHWELRDEQEPIREPESHLLIAFSMTAS